jgi:alpha-tubulin suppressor-like RCC1 family protein
MCHMLATRSRLLPAAATALVLSLGCREATEPTAFEPAGARAAASAPLTFRQISEGSDYTCGVTTTDLAYCWGTNNLGQLGNGTLGDPAAVPVAVTGGHRFRRVELGGGHACGVTTDDRAYCWGWNINGQLGDGTRDDRPLPVAVAGGLRFRQVSAGQYHTCGVTTDDRAYCWGYNRQGQAGDGSDLARHKRPVRVDGGRRYRMVSAGGLHSCGVTTDDRAFCWGLGSSGQLGNNKLVGSATPTAVAGGLAFLRVVAGETQRGAGYHSCGVATDQRAFCWGANLDGQLGDGTTTTRLRPTAVAGGIQFANVNPGADHTCGVSTGNVAYCWGYNYYGALGDGAPLGDGGPHPVPIAVTGGLALTSVTVGRVHSCGVTTDGAGWCWGGNTAGQLGDGAPDFATSTPRAVVGPD